MLSGPNRQTINSGLIFYPVEGAVMMKNEKLTLGEYFQEARKEKAISIDEIVRDTNIPKRYLESIESDNFDVFPGATYAMGFISNYAEALEVDKEVALSLYKRQMKIEQDSPIEQLVGRKNQFVLNNNIMIIGGVIAGFFIVVFLIALAIKNGAGKPDLQSPKNYLFAYDDLNSIANQKFRLGDIITITNTNAMQNVIITFQRIDPSTRALVLKANNVEYSMKNGELLSIDSDNNGKNDLGIELFTAKAKEIKLSISTLRESMETGTNAGGSDDLYNKYKEYILSESELYTAQTKTPIDLKIISSGAGWVNYSPDSKDEKEVFLNNGSAVNISFNNHLVLFLGNAGAVKLVIGSKEEAGGGWGETTKSIFYWKNKNNQTVLVRAQLK